MTYRLTPFEPKHLVGLGIQPAQRLAVEEASVSEHGYAEIAMSGPCFTGWRDDVVLGCAGMTPVYYGRAIVWAIVGVEAGRYDMVRIHRWVREFFDMWQGMEPERYRRLETVVHEFFEQGHRWAKMLGFESEGLMRGYDRSGRDVRLYARIAGATNYGRPRNTTCNFTHRNGRLDHHGHPAGTWSGEDRRAERGTCPEACAVR